MSKCMWVAIVVIVMAAGLVLAGPTENVTEVVPAGDVDRLEIEIDFGAGKIELTTADIEDAARIDINYTPRYVRYDIDYVKRSGTGRLYLESEQRRKNLSSDSENEWEIVLSNRYTTSIDMDIGACDAAIDLGGLPLTEFTLDVGASSGLIDFSRPNPERLRQFDIDVGASSLEVTNLANANFERMSFSGGAASCELDFRGDFKGESEVDLEIGVGSLDVIIPRGLAVRIEGNDDGWFSSVDFHGLDIDKVDDGVWESPNFDDADDRIIIMFEVAMGSIDIYSRR